MGGTEGWALALLVGEIRPSHSGISEPESQWEVAVKVVQWEREKQEISKLKQVEMQYPFKCLFNNWMGTEKKKKNQTPVLIDYLITLHQPT